MPKELRAWPKLTARFVHLARSLHREVCFINIAGAPECLEKRTVSWMKRTGLAPCFNCNVLVLVFDDFLTVQTLVRGNTEELLETIKVLSIAFIQNLGDD